LKKPEDKSLYVNSKNIEKIVCGLNQTFMILTNGNVLSFGRETHGRLGLGIVTQPL